MTISRTSQFFSRTDLSVVVMIPHAFSNADHAFSLTDLDLTGLESSIEKNDTSESIERKSQ